MAVNPIDETCQNSQFVQAASNDTIGGKADRANGDDEGPQKRYAASLRITG